MFGFGSWRVRFIALAIAAAPLGSILPQDFTADAVTADVVTVAEEAPAEEASDDRPRVVTTEVQWLTLDFSNAPADLWWALRFDDAAPAAWSDPDDAADRFYVPVGTWIDVPGGGYLATRDGWFGCFDHITAPEIGSGECSGPTGPVEPVLYAAY